MLTLGAQLCERILSFPRPVVTACNGHGVAAGCFLQLAADLRIGVDGPFQIGLNEVKIGLVMPQFVIDLARARLAPAHFDRAVNSAAMYSPADAVAAGFLDRVVAADELREAAHAAAVELTGLNADAHRATKLKSRADLIESVHAAIADEFSVAACGLRGDWAARATRAARPIARVRSSRRALTREREPRRCQLSAVAGELVQQAQELFALLRAERLEHALLDLVEHAVEDGELLAAGGRERDDVAAPVARVDGSLDEPELLELGEPVGDIAAVDRIVAAQLRLAPRP
jgi:enoyl-CoA hydratase